MSAAPAAVQRDDVHAVLRSTVYDLHGPAAELEDWTAAPLTKRGRQRVVRYQLCVRLADASQVDRYEWVGKSYARPEAGQRVATLLQQLSEAGTEPRAAFVIPRVLAYHAALELLGSAHSDWGVCSVLTAKPRAPVELGAARIEFLPHPHALRRRRAQMLGTRTVDRRGRSLRVTGPERTLLDGFRHPDRVGGLQELVESAAGFGVLDLALLRKLLETYGEKRLWAAAGWFLERHQQRFFVPHEYLASMAPHRPAAPRYLERGRRGGKLFSRWSLIVPPALASAAEPDEA